MRVVPFRFKPFTYFQPFLCSFWYLKKRWCYSRNNNVNLNKNNYFQDHNEGEESNFLNSLPIEDHDIASVSGASDVSTISERKALKRVKPSGDNQKEALSILKEARDNIIKRPAKDEFDVFGEYVASELRGVTGKRNILELKKQIQDLIYFTKLNEIKCDSYVSSRAPASQEQLSEPRVSTRENQDMDVAANLVLNSETEEISDTYEIRDDSGNILISFNK